MIKLKVFGFQKGKKVLLEKIFNEILKVLAPVIVFLGNILLFMILIMYRNLSLGTWFYEKIDRVYKTKLMPLVKREKVISELHLYNKMKI